MSTDTGPDHIVAANDGGLATETRAGSFTFVVDEPESMGGTDEGPSPYHHLGTALASCTSMTVRMYADRKGIPLDEVTTTVTFDRVHAEDCRDCEHTEGRIHRFDRTIRLVGDIDDDDRIRLVSIANRCPVHRTLEGQIEIHTSLTT